MLELLRIHDLALIEDLEMDFVSGMNVLTGETGAGKSFILKALHFLMGEKLSTDLVRPGKEKAVVEALFIVNDEDLVLRRELLAGTGRSRFYVNGQLSSQDTVRDMRASLVLHTSQHGQQQLLQPSFQARILDEFMRRPDLLARRDECTRDLGALAARRSALAEKMRRLEEQRGMFEYQLQEIEKVNPKPGEEEELETLRTACRHQEENAAAAAKALAALRGGDDNTGIFTDLAVLERAAATLAKTGENLEDLPAALVEIRVLLQDAESRLRRAVTSRRETDIDAVEARLYLLAQLKRKLKRPLEAIVSLRQEIADNLSFLDSCDLEQKHLDHEEQALCDALAGLLAILNPEREAAAIRLSAALQKELASLGFSEHVRVIFQFSPHALHPQRPDCAELRARLLWQPNPGQSPQPMDRIASGGELSRFLLALVSLISRDSEENPTLIFDEVDAGVGGITLNRVADSLAGLAASRQMLLITHWPQLAARAARHFVVEKNVADGQTYTHCRRLAPEAIPAELARMSGEESVD